MFVFDVSLCSLATNSAHMFNQMKSRIGMDNAISTAPTIYTVQLYGVSMKQTVFDLLNDDAFDEILG